MAWHKPTNLREWLDIVLRHKKKLFFVSVPITVTVIIASHYWERKYTAPAIVEVRTQLATEQINSPVAISAVKPIRSLLRQDLTSRRAISQVIDDEGLTHDLEFTADGELTKRGQILKNKMIKEMAERVGVNYITRNNSIDRVRISYTDPFRMLPFESPTGSSTTILKKQAVFLMTSWRKPAPFFVGRLTNTVN